MKRKTKAAPEPDPFLPLDVLWVPAAVEIVAGPPAALRGTGNFRQVSAAKGELLADFREIAMIADADGDAATAAQVFAGRWGLLGLCGCDLPAAHYRTLPPELAQLTWRRKQGDRVVAGSPPWSSCGTLDEEPVALWVRFARIVRAVLRAAERLRGGEKLSEPEVVELLEMRLSLLRRHAGRWLRDPHDEARALAAQRMAYAAERDAGADAARGDIHDAARSRARAEEAERLALHEAVHAAAPPEIAAKLELEAAHVRSRWRDPAVQRREVTEIVNLWLSLSGARAILVGAPGSWSFDLGGGPNLTGRLFTYLGMLLAARVAGQAWATCYHCGSYYQPKRRPADGERRYCPACRAAGWPGRDRSLRSYHQNKDPAAIDGRTKAAKAEKAAKKRNAKKRSTT